MKYKHTKEELQRIVNDSFSIADICKKLGIVAAGGNYSTLRRKLKENNISIEHFTGQGWNKGKNFKPFSKSYDLKDVLIKDSCMASHSLRKKLLREGVFKNICSECGITEWNGKSITCELDHINGVNNDNRLSNLRILCPNCHSQTPTFRNRNKIIN